MPEGHFHCQRKTHKPFLSSGWKSHAITMKSSISHVARTWKRADAASLSSAVTSEPPADADRDGNVPRPLLTASRGLPVRSLTPLLLRGEVHAHGAASRSAVWFSYSLWFTTGDGRPDNLRSPACVSLRSPATDLTCLFVSPLVCSRGGNGPFVRRVKCRPDKGPHSLRVEQFPERLSNLYRWQRGCTVLLPLR